MVWRLCGASTPGRQPCPLVLPLSAASRMPQRVYEDGQALISYGERGDELFLIRYGKVRKCASHKCIMGDFVLVVRRRGLFQMLDPIVCCV